MKKFSILTLALSMIALFSMAQTPILHWRFANPVVYDNAGVCTLEFDVELSCDMANTYHSDLQVYFDYNTLAFGENVVTNGVLTYTRLPLLQGDLAGTPLYAIFGNVDNKPYRYAILSEATFTVANPMFMNAVPMLPTFGGYIRVSMIIADQGQLAGIEYVPDDGGVGLMNGGQYYLDATHPTATKYGVPPDYAGVYENDLMMQPLSCTTDNTWTGAVDNDWFNPGNWSLNVVPTNEAVVIPDVSKAPFPVIFNGSATTGAITISPMASLEIAVNGDLTANGLVTNDGELWITSDGTGYSGSFIDNAGVAGAGMFYFVRNITNQAPKFDPTGWHYLSSPVEGFSTLMDLPDYYVNYWDEPADMWQRVEGMSPYCVGGPDIPMGPMDAWSVKYDMNYTCSAVYAPQGMDIDFMGTMADYRNGTYSTMLNYTGGNVYAGYNLVGNPYSSSLDPGTFTWDPNMNQSTYYWDGWANTYFSWAGGVGSMVPPTQGFFVSATAAGASFGVNPGNRDHETTQYFYKNEISNLLKLRAEGNNYSDVTYVRFHNEATSGFDRVWDAYKLISNAPMTPQIYTTLNGTNYSINAVESADAIPMAFTAGVSGNYTISIEENNDFDVVYLEDLKTGRLHDLSTAYEFSYNAEDDANRFVIHFGQVSLDNAVNGIVVYSYNNNVYVYNANNLQGDINIIGVMGQEVTTAQLNGGLNVITLNDVNTYYVVKVLTESTMVSEKVYIK